MTDRQTPATIAARIAAATAILIAAVAPLYVIAFTLLHGRAPLLF